MRAEHLGEKLLHHLRHLFAIGNGEKCGSCDAGSDGFIQIAFFMWGFVTSTTF